MDSHRRDWLTQELQQLGWFSTANGVRAGHLSEAQVRSRLESKVAERNGWLETHAFQPTTVGEATHDRIQGWCDRAEFLIAELATPTQHEETP
jgi:hypothetical protein